MRAGELCQTLRKCVEAPFENCNCLFPLQDVRRVHNVLRGRAPMNIFARITFTRICQDPNHRHNRMDGLINQLLDTRCIQIFGVGAARVISCAALAGMMPSSASACAERDFDIQPFLEQGEIIEHGAHFGSAVQVFEKD